MSSLAFNHVALSCGDPLATERYYARHFGFTRARVVPLGEGQQIVFLRNGGMLLELFQAEGGRPGPAPGADGSHAAGWRHIAFKVEDVEATLAAMGGDAHVTLGPLDFGAFIPGWRTVWVADPDGNVVEISQGFVDQDPATVPAAPVGGDR